MRERLRDVLRHYEPADVEADASLWPAAVLVLLYEHCGDLGLVFQKRTDKVDTHKGQVSFPGGGKDPEDRDLEATALRETSEEIGVDPTDVDILGRLDEMKTISGFAVRPYVGWLNRYPYDWVCSEDEVDYLLEVPLAHILDPANYVPDHREFNGRLAELPSYRFRDDLIWGATARMLQNFLDLYTTLLPPEAVTVR